MSYDDYEANDYKHNSTLLFVSHSWQVSNLMRSECKYMNYTYLPYNIVKHVKKLKS